MDEKFEDTYSFISKLQRRKMEESSEVEVKHDMVKDVDGKGKTKPKKHSVKKKADKPKPVKKAVPKNPNIIESKDCSINENILTLSAIEKIMKPSSNGKDGALGVIEYLKALSGGKLDPSIEQYIDTLYGMITGKKS